jgi:hypothetical protein
MNCARDKMVEIAKQEWEYFGRQSINRIGQLYRKGKRETDEGYWQRVGFYWKQLDYNIDGRDTNWAWSAAFMSYVAKAAGLGIHFKYSIRHSDYIRAIANGDSKYWVYRDIKTTAPKVGDIICYSRQAGVSYGRPLPKYFKSHGDLVVHVEEGHIEVIGGNVLNSVSLTRLPTTSKGIVVDTKKDWFCVLVNNTP